MALQDEVLAWMLLVVLVFDVDVDVDIFVGDLMCAWISFSWLGLLLLLGLLLCCTYAS